MSKTGCFVYAYADRDGVTVNIFVTAAERDAAVRDLLGADYSADDTAPFPSTATAEEAWNAVCERREPDFFIGLNEMVNE